MKKRRLLVAILACFGLNSANAQCSAGEVEVVIDVSTDAYGYETYWELIPSGSGCGNGTIFAGGNSAVGCGGAGAQNQTPGGYGNNLTITEGPWCLTEGASYDIVWIDDWGDGGLSFLVKIGGFPAYQFDGTGSGNTFTFVANAPLAEDAAVESIAMPGYLEEGVAHDVRATIKNVGSTNITTLEMFWSYNGGATQSSVITGLNIAPFDEEIVTHADMLTPWVNGAYPISVWTGEVNGVADLGIGNDSTSKVVEVGPGTPNYIDQYIGSTPSLTTIGNSSDGVNTPRDLDFHPILNRYELWVINKGTENSGGSTVTFENAGMGNQTSALKSDGNAWHFMSLPTALAFSDNTNFATTTGVYDANHNGGQPFTGPSLWSSDPAIYAQPSGGNGSHLDMLHESPECQGMAHDFDNAFWVFDGYNSDIVFYDFVDDHGPGNDDHSDAIIRRYSDVAVAKDPGDHIVSHMILDKNTDWLYVVDHGNDRVFRINTTTGNIGGTPSFGPFETLAEYSNVTGYTWENVVTTGLVEPSGIDLIEDRLIVSDHSNGDIIIYDINTIPATELGRVQTGTPGVMGVKIGPDGKIWYVNATTNEVVRVEALGVTVEETEQARQLALYPNPATDQLTLSVKGANWKGGVVTIMDASGRVVHTEANYQGMPMSIRHLNGGVYFVNMTLPNQLFETQKVIIK